MKTTNSYAIIAMCSHLCRISAEPLEPNEWTVCAEKLLVANRQPCDMLDFTNADFSNILGLSADQIVRYKRLLDRSASISMECTRLESMGIRITTRAEKDYPKSLKKKLGKNAPPLFYYCGDIRIADNDCIGFVGSRDIDERDVKFTEKNVKVCLDNQFSIVSGGAKGVDSVATQMIMRDNGVAIEYVSDSLSKRIKDNVALRRIRDGKLLILSSAIPTAGFNVGMAMQRNKYIYSQSLGTVVVRSDYNKGGTWAGAVENLKHNRSHTFCWNNPDYKGNNELIKAGAIPINDTFNPNDVKKVLPSKQVAKQVTKQVSIFDMLSDNSFVT